MRVAAILMGRGEGITLASKSPLILVLFLFKFLEKQAVSVCMTFELDGEFYSFS